MKKSILGLMGVAVASLLVMGCATKEVKGSGIKGKSGKMVSNKIEIVDYQGASFGSEIPQWVIEIGNGNYSSSVLAKIMPDLKGKKTFVTIAQGDNLEFVKQWTDLVDVEVQVGDTMQRVVGKAVSASETGSSSETGKNADPTELSRKLDLYKQAVSAVEVNGLEKVSSYWIEKTVTNKKDKVTKDVFEYYAVWAMDQKRFDTQVDAAMANVKDNSAEGAELRKALGEKLKNTMISSNSADVNEEADEQIVYAE